MNHRAFVRRAPTALSLLALCLLALATVAPSGAAAQLSSPSREAPTDRSIRADDAFRISRLEAAERMSVESEASAADALYITAAVTLSVSAILELTAVALVLASDTGSVHGLGLRSFEILGALGGVIGGLGVIALPLAIGLHVDSHSRRDALGRRRCGRLSLGPTSMSLSGCF